MNGYFTAGTIFTFLIAVSASRISLNSPPNDLLVTLTDCDLKSPPESTTGDSTNLVVVQTDRTKSGSDEADQVEKLVNDRMFRVDLTPRSDFARFHAINRRFNEHRVPIRFDHQRPYRHLHNPFVLPKSEISHRNEVTVNRETGNFVARNLHHRGSPSVSRLKFKRDYEHHHHHHRHQVQHHHMHRNSKDVSMPKHEFVTEKMNSFLHQHIEKSKEHEVSNLMKSIRKFLKHTFD